MARKILGQTALCRCTISLMGLGVGMGASACQDQLPVVAQGRYVEIATDRTDEICGGTVKGMDDFLEMVFAEIGETPSDRILVRYEWNEPRLDEDGFHLNGGAMVQDREGQLIVLATRLLHEHELAHVVHLQAWPKRRPFLQEGFAMLFDSDTSHMQDLWPAGEPLDPLLEDGSLDRAEYFKAWFLVSQIVHDHGMDGLHELWHAVPPDASAEQVRQAYQDLFGRSIDALIEPREYYEGGPVGERWSCYFTVCGEPQPWDGDVWRAEGPFDCDDDPDALGPMGPSGTGTVERHHVVELEDSTLYRFTASGGAGAYVRPCGLQCLPRGAPADAFWPAMPGSRADLRGGRYRVEIISRFEDLPTETPGSFEIERLD